MNLSDYMKQSVESRLKLLNDFGGKIAGAVIGGSEMLKSLSPHRIDFGSRIAGLAGVGVSAFLAMAEPVSAQVAQDEAEVGTTPGRPGLATPPSVGDSSSPAGEGIGQFAVMANMAGLTEMVISNVALLSGTSSCDTQADLAYSGEIESNVWMMRLTGTYAGRPVTLAYNGTVSAVHQMGRFEGSGAFGDEAWTSSGSVAFSPNSEFMSLKGSVATGAATPVWEWDANWVISEGGETDSANAINVFRQQNRPLIIIVIQGTWRHTTYWLHSVIIDIVFFDAVTREKNACRVRIEESGEQAARGHFRVKGGVTVELPAATEGR